MGFEYYRFGRWLIARWQPLQSQDIIVHFILTKEENSSFKNWPESRLITKNQSLTKPCMIISIKTNIAILKILLYWNLLDSLINLGFQQDCSLRNRPIPHKNVLSWLNRTQIVLCTMPYSHLVTYISHEAKIKVATINDTLEEELRFRKIHGATLISKLKLLIDNMSTR